MIKLKSFDVKDTESANDFLEQYPPRSTEKQSGIVFHNGSILIIYDDGQENPEEKKALIRTLIDGEKHKLFLIEHRMAEAEIALKELKPKGYSRGMTNDKVRKLISGKDDYASEMIDEHMLNTIRNQIHGLEDGLLMDRHELRRLQYSVTAYEHQLQQ